MTFSISTCILSWDLHISLRWILLLANLWLVLFTFTCYTYAKSIILMLNIWWIKILSLQLNITSGEVGDLFTLILIKITLLSLGHIVEVLDTLVKFCMLAVFCMSLWICIEEFLFKVLCEFVWSNSCSKYCVNLYGGILVQSIMWICMEELLFKVLCELSICTEEFLFKVLCEFVRRNSCSMYCVNLYGGILVQCIVWICTEEFLFNVLCEFVRRNSCSKYCVNLYGGILVQCIVWICTEEFLFNVLCEFVWKNSCSKYCVNLYGGILVQCIVWICMEEFFFKVLCEFFWRNSC